MDEQEQRGRSGDIYSETMKDTCGTMHILLLLQQNRSDRWSSMTIRLRDRWHQLLRAVAASEHDCTYAEFLTILPFDLLSFSL